MDGGWHAAFAEALVALETPRFAPALVRALDRVAVFDYCVVFAYRGEARPLCLFENFGPARRDIFVGLYQAGPYLLDPFYHASRGGAAPGLHRMRSLAPDRFYQSEYYRSYYRQTGLAEEIGFFLWPGAPLSIVLSLMRDGRRSAFVAAEIRRLQAVAPVVLAACARHWQGLAQEPRPAEPAPVLPWGMDLAALFDGVGDRRLTRRECEVAALVLRGHSSEAIARQLRIAAGTVKIHRKNIYAKLGIASQAALFSLFLSAIPGRG